MMDRGTKVFYRQPTADDPINGDTIHLAWITGHQTETKLDLWVKPNQSLAFDVSGVEISGSQAEGAACWSPWLESLTQTQPA